MPAALPQIAVVRGAEGLLVSRAVQAHTARAREADPELEVTDVLGAELDLPTLMDLTSPSLFGDRRLMVVRDAQEVAPDVLDALVGYVQAPAEGIGVLLVHDGAVKGKRLPEAALAAGAHLTECAKITKAGERLAFLKAEFNALGRTVGEPALRLLIETVGTDLRGLASAASQLAADVPGALDERAVGRYYSGRVDIKGFAVADRAIDGDAAGALELLRWALLEGIPPVLVTSAFASGLRSLAKVGGAGRGNAFALAKQLGMPPWQVEKAQRQLRGWGPRGLSTATREVARADAGVKGGAVDSAYALEAMVLDVTRARHGE